MNRRYKKNNTETIRIGKGAYVFFKDQLVDRGIPDGSFSTVVDLVINEFKGLRRKEQNKTDKRKLKKRIWDFCKIIWDR